MIFKKHLTSFKKFIAETNSGGEMLYPKFTRSKDKFFLTFTRYSGIDRNSHTETYQYIDDQKTYICIKKSIGYGG